ncbi:hypothetical protein AN221_25010, partial [Streptomyces nanshensis]
MPIHPPQQQQQQQRSAPGRPLGVQQAEAALVEHYPRLVRLAYVVLPPALGRHRRVLAAHGAVQRALPGARAVPAPASRVPAQSRRRSSEEAAAEAVGA